MILQGNQRGGAKNLALHLLKDENEHVELHELRGFVSETLAAALNESYALSRGTKARQHLFSLSLNPPPDANVPTSVFEDAIARAEQKLGLTDQPRAIVFHEKEGRRHCHAVWSRIDTENMKAIPLPFTKRKLMDISRELYLEQGWTMPRGFMDSKERDPANFTLEQWQQAKRTGKDPKTIKRVFQDCWAVSDSQSAFRQALKERGYTLARGDRRGFVALNHACEIFAVPKWVGIKTKEARAKLTDPAALPSVDEARAQVSQTMGAHLKSLRTRQQTAIDTRLTEIETKRIQMAQEHRGERAALRKTQQDRIRTEILVRQDRYRKGLRGLLDRMTGRHRRIKDQNERETYLAAERDRQEKDALIFRQLETRRILQARIARLKRWAQERAQTLEKDIEQYRDIERQKRETGEFHRSRQPTRSRSEPDRAPGREM